MLGVFVFSLSIEEETVKCEAWIFRDDTGGT